MTSAPLDLDALEAAQERWDRVLRTGSMDAYIMTKKSYEDALLRAAPALIAMARERDALRHELDQMDGVHERAQIADADLRDARAETARLREALEAARRDLFWHVV